MAIVETGYKGQAGYLLENEWLRVIVVHSFGGKIASLVWKATGAELVTQNAAERFITAPYASNFGAAECAGWDDMWPTISEEVVAGGPWQGAVLPDHGEVWALPWEARVEGETLVMTVHGVRLPYRFSKRVTLKGPQLCMDYEAENLSPFELDVLFTAHPLLSATEGMQIVVPVGCDEILYVGGFRDLGGHGVRLAFPQAQLANGETFALDRMPANNGDLCQKYYFAKPVREGWCLLLDEERDLKIGMTWPAAVLPWLGMWISEGRSDSYCIAPEPATAPMDSPARARAFGAGNPLSARGVWRWHLNLSVAAGAQAQGMTEDGAFV